MLPLVLILFADIAVVYYLSSRLIRLEYESHRDSWVEDGKPRDDFSQVPGSYMARAVIVAWLFMTPDWMKTNATARRLVAWYRVLSFIFFGGWILIAYLQAKG